MNYGLLTYEENKKNFNVGDNIQSLAARQFLPQVDAYINREKLADHKGGQTKIILNGWFTHNAEDWVPADDIDPLFISFHMNNTAAPLMLSKRGIAYLKEHEPIGCRDHYTVSILEEKGIDAYFSGCLTLTLDSYKVEESERGEDIYVVDPLYGYPTKEKVFYNFKSTLRSIYNGDFFQLGKRKKHIETMIDSELLEKASHINQVLPSKTYSDEQKFVLAEDLLRKYARAKLVITSRIHCALPCIALGTPVIFVNGFANFVDSCRFEGIVDFFNRIDINIRTGAYTSNFELKDKIDINLNIRNPEKHNEIAQRMKERCKEFIT